MGSFNTICGISGLQIIRETPIYLGFLVEKTGYEKKGAGYFAENFSFASPLFETEYNDYGSGTILDDYNFDNIYLNKFFENCRDSKGEAINKNNYESLAHVLDGINSGIVYGGKINQVHLWMCRKDVVDKISLLSNEYNWDDEYFAECLERYTTNDFLKSSSDLLGSYTGLKGLFRNLYRKLPDFENNIKLICKVASVTNYCNKILEVNSAFGSQSIRLDKELSYLKVFCEIAEENEKRLKKEGY